MDNDRASLAVRAAAASETPHACELDRWMTDPADVDYVEPDARWCRVCLRHPSHSIHSAPRIALAEANARVTASAMRKRSYT